MYDSPPVTDDPMEAINSIGEIIQKFSIELKESRRSRDSLGLPRKNNNKRHASPAQWSLSRGKGGELMIQMIGFPSENLPQSKQVLGELRDYANSAIKSKAGKAQPRGQISHTRTKGRQQHQHSGLGQVNQISLGLPSSGEEVRVLMLEETTKKGYLKAKHLESGLIGSMVDHDNTPDDINAGQEKDVIIHHANENSISFRWKPLPSKKKSNKRN